MTSNIAVIIGRFQILQRGHGTLLQAALAVAPKLLTVKHDGKMVDIVAEAGKNGFLYVVDRVTGKPICPIEERPVPQSDMPGEHSWPTQPFPTAPPPFAQQSFTPDDVDPYTRLAHAVALPERRVAKTERPPGRLTRRPAA